MKRYISGLLIILFFSCTGFFDTGDEEIRALNNPSDPDYVPKTFITFDNPRFYSVDVYGTSLRSAKIETVPSNGEKGPIPWINTERFDFYLTYQMPLPLPEGFPQKTASYIPKNIHAGFITSSIPRNTTTTITIINLEDFIDSEEILVPNNAVLVIKNSGSSAFRLLSGSSVIESDISPNFVNGGQTALYILPPTTFVSGYSIFITSNIPLPQEITSLQAGCLYIIDFNGVTATLKDQLLLTFENCKPNEPESEEEEEAEEENDNEEEE